MTTFLHAPRQVQNQLLRAHRRITASRATRNGNNPSHSWGRAGPVSCLRASPRRGVRPRTLFSPSHASPRIRHLKIPRPFSRSSIRSWCIPAAPPIAFYNKRGICEQWIKEGKAAINWTRLSCRTFAANAVRLQLYALAYNLGNFLRTLAIPVPIKDWSLSGPKEKLIKIGAKVVSRGRYVAFQMAEVG